MSSKQIRVRRVPEDRTSFVRALRLVGRMGLKQASDLAVHLDRFRNSVLVAGIDPEVADHLLRVLQDSGAEVVVENSSVDAPMLCFPRANTKYEWGPFRLVKKTI